MNVVKRVFLMAVILVSSVGCDQATKSIAKSIIPETESWSYLGDTVRLQVVYNRGTYLSLGSWLPEAWRFGPFSIGAGCLLLGVLTYAVLPGLGHPSVVAAVALLFAGGVGNLIDGVTSGGSVVDFINLGIGPVRTGIFNVADVAITVGALILLSDALRRQSTE
jgi:signal peptidase II